MLSELWAAFNPSTFVVASVLTVSNLLAIWVGVSRRPWFLRLLILAALGWAVIAARVYEGAAFLTVQGAGTLLLLVCFRRGRQEGAGARGSDPAPEGTDSSRGSGRPAVGGLGEVGRPAPGVRIAPHDAHHQEMSSAPRWRVRFHLSDMLLANAVIAAFLGELTYAATRPGTDQWPVVVALGLAAALLSSSAVWLAWGQSRLWIRTFVFALAALPSLGVGYWAEDPMRSKLGVDTVSILSQAGVSTLANASLLTAALLLYRCAFPASFRAVAPPHRPPRKWATRLAQGGLVMLAAALVIPTAALAWALTRPLPQPEIPPPGSNAYQELLQIANNISATTVPDAGTAPAHVLQTYARQQEHTAARLHAALSRPCRAPVDWTPGSANMPLANMQALRNSSRFLSACGRGELSAGRVSEAAEHFLDNMRLGHRTAHGGLLIDWLVGVAIEGVGIHDLASVRQRLSQERVCDVRRTLLALEADREPWDAVQQRDRDWVWLVWGWRGRLPMILEQPLSAWFFSGPLPPSDPTYVVDLLRRARFGLLVTELALREYILEHGRSPETLTELVPCHLAAIPSDPFSGQPLVYRQRGDGYLLYSVGANGIDDGGLAAEYSEMLQGHGDLFLDAPAAMTAKPPTLDPGADGEN